MTQKYKTVSQNRLCVHFNHCHWSDLALFPAVKKHSGPARLKATDLISDTVTSCCNTIAKSLLRLSVESRQKDCGNYRAREISTYVQRN